MPIDILRVRDDDIPGLVMDVHHQARDIVITHAQNIDWHIFRQRNQTLGVQIDFNAAAAE